MFLKKDSGKGKWGESQRHGYDLDEWCNNCPKVAGGSHSVSSYFFFLRVSIPHGWSSNTSLVQRYLDLHVQKADFLVPPQYSECIFVGPKPPFWNSQLREWTNGEHCLCKAVPSMRFHCCYQGSWGCQELRAGCFPGPCPNQRHWPGGLV
jgi:hypothetical protein